MNMQKDIAHAVRKNRVAAMAETGASPDAWAEVLLACDLNKDKQASLLDLQSWCRRAAEDAENRRLIEDAEKWALTMALREKSLRNATHTGASAQPASPLTIEQERDWLSVQMTEMPPPTRSPGWSLSVTLTDLIQFSFANPHAAVNPEEWREELIQILKKQVQRGQEMDETGQPILVKMLNLADDIGFSDCAKT